jgi:hypothetical protein
MRMRASVQDCKGVVAAIGPYIKHGSFGGKQIQECCLTARCYIATGTKASEIIRKSTQSSQLGLGEIGLGGASSYGEQKSSHH